MEGKAHIYIFSRPIRSGKTTELLEWIRHERKVAGILMPDINGSRMLAEIVSGDVYEFQVEGPGDGIISVGKYHFKQEIFNKGKEILLAWQRIPVDWIVVDEVGKLEMEGRGFEPAVTELVKEIKDGARKERLLLVIRDNLLEAAVKQFQLEGAVIVNELKDLP
jgi:nucleoside-triphosphatase THEP1